MLVVAVVKLVLQLVSFVEAPASASVVGHATGLIVGIAAGIGERYISVEASD